jgi:alkylation response protein AidB-like acyl-CoA dehydrogenase
VPSVTADLETLTARLKARAHAFELDGQWPRASLDAYSEMSAWRWSVPPEYGGQGLATHERLATYLALARGDMSVALYVTQHEGAVDLVVSCDNEALKQTWLPRFASGLALTTIGYSQLTTSRQGGAPAMRARAVDDGYVLDGVMPWVTGAPYVDNVACGAVLEDGRQILVLLDMATPGVRVVPAEPLAALNSTHTCEVFCEEVAVANTLLIAGPEQNVLSHRSALRLLLVSATGAGLALAIMDELYAMGGHDYDEVRKSMDDAMRMTRAELELLAERGEVNQEPIDALRIEVNCILLRLAGILMVVAKGSGYRRRAIAQRLAAEANFFAVWSASGRVRAATAKRLAVA